MLQEFPLAQPFADEGAMEAFREGLVVLVAEDDPHALSGYLEFLGRSGFVASGSADGKEALGLAVETVPDIVVTDINMPGLDGFALAAALRADRRTRHVPLLGMTGHWTTEMQNEAQRAGLQRDAAEAVPAGASARGSRAGAAAREADERRARAR